VVVPQTLFLDYDAIPWLNLAADSTAHKRAYTMYPRPSPAMAHVLRCRARGRKGVGEHSNSNSNSNSNNKDQTLILIVLASTSSLPREIRFATIPILVHHDGGAVSITLFPFVQIPFIVSNNSPPKSSDCSRLVSHESKLNSHCQRQLEEA
jgi:hypothetical protein